MKILHFKKGDPVPEWVLRSTWKRHILTFVQHVTVVKYGRVVVVHPEEKSPNTALISITTSGSQLFVALENLWFKLTNGQPKLIGFPTQWCAEPVNYADVAKKINRGQTL